MSGVLKQRLASVITANGEGVGPVEREVRQRASAGLPMSSLQITAYAEACYPAEVQAFLDDLGYHRLYRDDLARAAAYPPAVAGLAADESAGRVVIAKRSRPASQSRTVMRVFLVAVVALAAVATTVIVMERPRPLPVTFDLPAIGPMPSSVVRSAEDMRCRSSLRDASVAWCVRALTGTGPGAPQEGFQRFAPLSCGEPMAANAETLRRALDGVMDEDALYTYRAADAARLCAAAGARTVPH